MVTKNQILESDADELLGSWDERRFRDNEALRKNMVPLIAELGTLVQRHAQQMGDEAGHGCTFQVDRFADVMLWQIIEYITQAQCSGDYRLECVNPYQMSERHARDFFEWPPVLEGESQMDGLPADAAIKREAVQ